jgi:hypothetical protein
MVDRLARDDLRLHVRRLVTGRMTNDEFDDVVYAPYCDHEDRAVQEITYFGWSLYGDLQTYRLKGRHAVDRDNRRAAARCILFLRSGLEYEWPSFPGGGVAGALAGCTIGLGLPLGIALMLISLALLVSKDYAWFSIIALTGTAVLAARSVVTSANRRRQTQAWDAFRANGHFDVWPFIHREEFDEARRTLHMLGGAHNTA